eukprot:12936015-Prorocentrum_lima.AAC.1
MDMTKVLGLMQGHLSRQDTWVVAPPIAGRSDVVLAIRRSHPDPGVKVVVTPVQAEQYARVRDELIARLGHH